MTIFLLTTLLINSLLAFILSHCPTIIFTISIIRSKTKVINAVLRRILHAIHLIVCCSPLINLGIIISKTGLSK